MNKFFKAFLVVFGALLIVATVSEVITPADGFGVQWPVYVGAWAGYAGLWYAALRK